MFAEPAKRNGEAEQATTGGAAILVRSHLGAQRVALPAELPAERFQAIRLRLRQTTVVIIAVYLISAIGATGENLKMIAALGTWIECQGRGFQFILAGDFNLDEEELEAIDLPNRLGTKLLTHNPKIPYTCKSGGGERGSSKRTIDHYLVSTGLAPAVRGRGVDLRGPWRPHRGIMANILQAPRTIMVRVPKLPKPLPRASWANIEAIPQEEVESLANKIKTKATPFANEDVNDYLLEHPKKQQADRLGDSYATWVSRLEARRCLAAGLTDYESMKHTGRASTTTFELRPLLPTRPAEAPWGGGAAVWWKTLAARLAELATERPGHQADRIMEAIAFLGDPPDTGDQHYDGFFWLEQLATIAANQASWPALAEEAAKAEQQAERTARNTAGQKWKQWVQEATMGTAAAAFKAVKADESASHQGEAGVTKPYDALALADQRAAFWAQRWRRDKELARRLRLLVDRLAPAARLERAGRDDIDDKLIKRAVAALSPGRGKALDGLSVPDLRSMTRKERGDLAELLNDCELDLAWPRQCCLVHTLLTFKAGGGDRPISLLMLIYAVWTKARLPEQQSWDRQHAAPFDAATEGRGPLHDLWLDEATAELAVARGERLVGALLDMTAFYDYIDLHRLLCDGAKEGLPLTSLILNIEMYLCPRYTTKYGCTASRAIIPFNSIVAGCTNAVTNARCYMAGPTKPIADTFSHLGVRMRQYIDDLGLRAVGGDTAVDNGTAATLSLLHRLTEKKMIISTKSQVLATKAADGREMANRLAEAGWAFPVARAARDLGIDTSFGRRRAVAIQRARAKAGKSRAAKILTMTKACRQARRIHRAAAQTKSVWGAAVQGLPPTQAARLRSGLAKTTGLGGCPITAIAVTYGLAADPEAQVRRQQVELFFRHFEQSLDFRVAATRQWQEVRDRTLTGEQKHRWRRVRGPLGALMLGLAEDGWELHSATRWTSPSGDTFVVTIGEAIAPILREVQKGIEHKLWQQAAQHQDGAGLELIPDTSVVKNRLASLRRQGRQEEATMLGKIVTGGAWSQAMRHAAGYVDTATCQLCGLAAADYLHSWWECPQARALVDTRVANTEAWVPEASTTEEAAAWRRGLVPKYWTHFEGVIEERRPTWTKGPAPRSLMAGGTFATDGSGGSFTSEPGLRRVGWAFAQAGAHGDPAAFGWCCRGFVVGGQEQQTVPRAELTAVIALAEATGGRVKCFTDHRNIVRLFGRGEAILRNPRLQNSDLWSELFRATSQHEAFEISWCPSHLDDPRKMKIKPRSVPGEAVVANFVADALAGVAATEALSEAGDLPGKQHLTKLAKSILGRLEAVGKYVLEATTFHKAGKALLSREGRAAARRQACKQARRATSHSLFLVVAGRSTFHRCRRCFGSTRPSEASARRLSFLRARCCREVGAAHGGPHISHSPVHLGNRLACSRCGAEGQGTLRALQQPCPGKVTSGARGMVVRALGNGPALLYAADDTFLVVED